MPWALGLVKTNGGGIPAFDTETYKYKGHIYIGEVAGWGAYLLSGTAAQLTAINALPEAVGIAVMTQTEDGVKWRELDDTVTLAVRNRLNTWLTARGYPTIPAGWSNRRVVLAVFQKINPNFQIEMEWV